MLSLCEGYLIYFSWTPFSFNYNYLRALNDVPNEDAVEQTNAESDKNEIHPLDFYDPDDETNTEDDVPLTDKMTKSTAKDVPV